MEELFSTEQLEHMRTTAPVQATLLGIAGYNNPEIPLDYGKTDGFPVMLWWPAIDVTLTPAEWVELAAPNVNLEALEQARLVLMRHWQGTEERGIFSGTHKMGRAVFQRATADAWATALATGLTLEQLARYMADGVAPWREFLGWVLRHRGGGRNTIDQHLAMDTHLRNGVSATQTAELTGFAVATVTDHARRIGVHVPSSTLIDAPEFVDHVAASVKAGSSLLAAWRAAVAELGERLSYRTTARRLAGMVAA